MTDRTPRALVQAALRHESTDRVPFNVMLSPLAQERLQAFLGERSLPEYLGCCLYLYGCGDKPLYASPAVYGPTISDQFGVVWSTSDLDRGYPIRHPLTAPALAGYDFPDPREPGRWANVANDARKHPHCYRLAVVGDLWERANFLRGLQPLLLDLYEHPAFVHDLLDRIAEYNLANLEGMVPHSPDGIFLSDDYGLQRSLMMRPQDWREFVKPRLARVLQAAQAHGLTTMLHSCGCVWEVIPDLVALGLDILHPVQPEALDLGALKREFGRDLTFCGGVNTQQLLPGGTPEQVRKEVFRLADEMGAGGGYILEPGITVQADVPVENLVALVEAAHEYRRG